MTFGIIIHYGLYSYYGYDDINSAKRKRPLRFTREVVEAN
jgi:hypothetical protein